MHPLWRIFIAMKPGNHRWPVRGDTTVFVPLFVLFVMTLSGPSLGVALTRSLGLFFGSWSAAVLWGQVIVLDLALLLYFLPVFRAHLSCSHACDPDERTLAMAVRRLNRTKRFTIFASIAVFAAGRFVLFAMEPGLLAPDLSLTLARNALALTEASIAGFFVGVILALQVEDRLFSARMTIVAHSPEARLSYSSLSGKTGLVILAILLFLTLQALSFANGFFDLLPALGPAGDTAAPAATFHNLPDIADRMRQFGGLGKLLQVFLFRTAVLGLFVIQMLFQLKRAIRMPLETIHERLEKLSDRGNGPGVAAGLAAGGAIEIVQNDEFAPVLRQIDAFIRKQGGQLEATRRRFEDVVAGAADPIVAFDDALILRLCNPAAEAFFGYPREYSLGKPLSLLLGDGAASLAGSADGVAGEEGSSLGRISWRSTDGAVRLLEYHLSRSGEGPDAWTTAILRDVTERAELEETLRRAKEEAENASRMKSEFLANMSHELRTPLNAILGFTQLLDTDRNLTESQHERVRIISRSGEHLLALINDILDISKIEAGRTELHLSAFDLHGFLKDLRDMFELKCSRQGLSLYADMVDGLPRYVRGDLGKLRQVMVNLVGNAVKFTDEGGVGILAGTDGDRVRFSVRDTGRGIPPEEQRAILQPFVQASTTDHEGGTGLGLAISSRYIALMGGSLEVKSEPGKGSEFSFTIPLERVDGIPRRERPGYESIRLEPGSRATALVADDQEANRLVLGEMLRGAGFTVVEAANGREAVDRARESRPAIVFMDIKMPVLDGYGAAAAIKSDPASAGAKVFALTASAFAHDEARIMASGFDGFLAKPFKLGDLYALIAERGGVPLLAVAERPEPDRARGPSPLPDGASAFGAAKILGADGLARLAGMAAINDFGGLAREADSIGRGEGSPEAIFAAALSRAAKAYDEDEVAALLAMLASAAEGDAANGR